jgi:hypothetical protein
MKKTTAIFFVVTLVAFALIITAYDIWAISKGGTEASISHLLYEWSYKYPILNHLSGMIEGMLIGHLLWRIRDTATTKKLSDFSRS